MVKITKKRSLYYIILLALIVISLSAFSACWEDNARTENIITSYSELKASVKSAKDGDTLYVGDIDFTPPGTVANHLMRLNIDRNVTIANGKKDGKAVFTNGGFILSGGKAHGEKITVRFQGVIFDGKVDAGSLVFSDFYPPWDEGSGRNVSEEPVKSQRAVSFKGNVDAAFDNCDFQNYMHEYGPIMYVRYGDYTTTGYEGNQGDYSGCLLNIRFNRCNLSSNSASYGGGAIYVHGNNNVNISASDCVFKNNRVGGSEYSLGGGAIYVHGANLSLDGCRVEGNTANYVYDGIESPEEDVVSGGGIYVDNAELYLKDTVICSNTSSMGGGLSLTNVRAEIDGCVFTENRATTEIESPYGDTGPMTNMAQGGAIYHEGNNGAKTTVINSSIYNNSAKTAYGGIYSYYNLGCGEDDVYLDMIFCNYVGNTCDSKYDYSDEGMLAWCSHPGDILSIPYIMASGCVIVDDSFDSDFKKHQSPSAENDYNYIASPSTAKEDGVSIDCQKSGRLLVTASPNMDFEVPSEFSKNLMKGRYEEMPLNMRVGNNCSQSVYSNEITTKIIVYVILGAMVVVLGGFSATVIYRMKTRNAQLSKESACKQIGVVEKEVAVSEATPTKARKSARKDVPINLPTQIVKAWFTGEEVKTIFASYPKIQTLTARETEVLREILDGKKQKEIAYDLGIEITTVKDFYRKIYDKLDFANKDDLLRKLSEIVSR